MHTPHTPTRPRTPSAERASTLTNAHSPHPNQVKNAKRGESLNPYCVVLVGGVEVGRTTTIAHSSEPLWATEFHLPEDLFLGATCSPPRNARNVVGDSRGVERVTPRPSPGVVVAMEVWDSVPEGDPVLLGAAEVPPDALQSVLSSSPRGGQDAGRNRAVRTSEAEGGDEDNKRRGGGFCEGPRGSSSDLRLFSVDLRPCQEGKQPLNRQLASVVSGEESRTTAIEAAATAEAADATAGDADRSGAAGVLSFSLKRVVSDAVKGGSAEGHNHPQATTEDAYLDEESGNVAAGVEKEVVETRITEVRATVSQSLRLLFCWRSGARSCKG